MKIRKGFVSNSSSSSFIIMFDKVPKNATELQNILFGDMKECHHPYEKRYCTTEEVSKEIFDNLTKIESRKQLNSKLNGILVDDFGIFSPPKYDENKDMEKEWEKYRDRISSLICDKEIKSGKIYHIEIGDSYDLGCIIEHGEAFNYIPHYKISKH